MNHRSSSGTAGLLVNVGCGSRFHPAWKNFDLHSHAPEVTACDLTQGIPLADSTASAVYSAAVLEHVRRPDVPGFLRECHRVLESGGWIRIAVPDFRRQVEVYLDAVQRLDSGDATAELDRDWMILEMIDQVGRDKSGGGMAAFLSNPGPINEAFVVQRIGAEGRSLRTLLQGKNCSPCVDFKRGRSRMIRGKRFGRMLFRWLLGSEDLERDLLALEVGRFRVNSGEVHQWVYDHHSLKKVLSGAGFVDLQVMSHGESRIAGWPGYHLEVDQNGNVEKPDLLIVEGRKVPA